jgi:hypothetical protein
VLTKTLANRVKRDVALEKASASEPAVEEEEVAVVVVLGPDGVPQLADPVESAPETVRIQTDDTPSKR